MPVNLFLNLDDELEKAVRQSAIDSGRSWEEEFRKRIVEGVGGVWNPLNEEDILNVDRLNITLDLRTQ